MQARVNIGTSGWNYKHWSNGVFYPPGLKPAEWLPYYARFFDTVEVNNTFYNLPARTVFEKWREQTPVNFHFVLKASRFYTHMKRLIDPQVHMEQFLAAASGLGDKLAMVLYQLPKNFAFRAERLEGLLAYLKEQTVMPGVLAALEIRDPSWYVEECFQILRRYNAALVLADWPGFAAEGPVTANFVYVRRHGPWAIYASNYPDDLLRRDEEHIRGWLSQGLEVWEYFNNDAQGFAVRNALTLKEWTG